MAESHPQLAEVLRAFVTLKKALPQKTQTSTSDEQIKWTNCQEGSRPYPPTPRNLSRNTGPQNFDKNGNICLTSEMHAKPVIPEPNYPRAKKALSDLTTACALLAADAQPILMSNIQCADTIKFGESAKRALCGTLLHSSGEPRCTLNASKQCKEISRQNRELELN